MPNAAHATASVICSDPRVVQWSYARRVVCLTAAVVRRPDPGSVVHYQCRVFNLGEPLGENCTASIVDLDSMQVAAELALPGRPRWTLYDEERDRVYANVRDPAEIVVVDCERVEIERRLPMSSEGPHGLWLDRGRLFCAADGGALVVLDPDSGAVLRSLPLPGVPDVVMHDPVRRRLYVAIGEPGVVCSFDSDRLELVETVETEPGAHTTGWDPDSHCLYVFCPVSGGAAVYEERA